MVTAIIVLHITVCIALVIVVLLQQGKGADVGAVFGGSSQTNFGASTTSSPLFKLTWTFAVLFAATSLYLAYSGTKRVSGSVFEGRTISRPARPAALSGPPSMGEPAAPAPAVPASNPAPAK